MSKKNYTHIVCVIDRSGSMGGIREDAQGGFNAFVEDQKKVPGEATITLAQFDTEYEMVWKHQKLQDVKNYTLMPRGRTALLDAVGKTINETGAFLDGMSEDNRPDRVIFVVVTDGMENASHEFTRSQISEMITHQREKYQWEFVFLAANQDALGEAASIGIPRNMAMNFAATGDGVQSAYRKYSSSLSRSRVSGKREDLKMPEHADDESKKESEGRSPSSSS